MPRFEQLVHLQQVGILPEASMQRDPKISEALKCSNALVFLVILNCDNLNWFGENPGNISTNCNRKMKKTLKQPAEYLKVELKISCFGNFS